MPNLVESGADWRDQDIGTIVQHPAIPETSKQIRVSREKWGLAFLTLKRSGGEIGGSQLGNLILLDNFFCRNVVNLIFRK